MPSLKVNPNGTLHIHEYVRVQDPFPEKKRPIRYRCAHPDCTHYMEKELLLGKRTICSICHTTETVMDYENLRRVRPNCFKCSNSKKAQSLRERLEVFDDLFPQSGK